jgi:hypothetical protein
MSPLWLAAADVTSSNDDDGAGAGRCVSEMQTSPTLSFEIRC